MYRSALHLIHSTQTRTVSTCISVPIFSDLLASRLRRERLLIPAPSCLRRCLLTRETLVTKHKSPSPTNIEPLPPLVATARSYTPGAEVRPRTHDHHLKTESVKPVLYSDASTLHKIPHFLPRFHPSVSTPRRASLAYSHPTYVAAINRVTIPWSVSSSRSCHRRAHRRHTRDATDSLPASLPAPLATDPARPDLACSKQAKSPHRPSSTTSLRPFLHCPTFALRSRVINCRPKFGESTQSRSSYLHPLL